LLNTLQNVFKHAGIIDITYAVIDDTAVYLDDAESDYADLDQLLTAAKEEGFYQKPFREVIMGLSVWESGVQHLIEASACMEVPAGEHELQIQISSRPDDCNARRLDDAERYARRLAEYAADVDKITAWRDNAQRVADRVVEGLRVTLFRRDISAQRTRMEIVRPSREHLQSMENVEFGEWIMPPKYSLDPPLNRPSDRGVAWRPWPDPAIHVYPDDFLVFRHWAFLVALMVGGSLRFEWVAVTEPDGKTLFTGHKAKWFENWPWAKKFDVDFIEEAGVKVRFHD
jgi:hypothetical protein